MVWKFKPGGERRVHWFGRPDHVAADFAPQGLCASSAGVPWPLGLSDSASHLRALPSEGWASPRVPVGKVS